MVLVSVIIPTHDRKAMLLEAIASVRAQGVADIEIIVVDDGSTDGTEHAMRGHDVVYLQQEKAGAATARNRGLALAKGEFIGFLDSDDRWARRKLELQLAAFAGDAALDFVFGHQELFGSGIPVPGPITPAPICGTLLGRRAAIRKLGEFDSANNFGEFIEWFSRGRVLGLKECMLPDVLLHRREHSGNMTNAKANPVAGFLPMIQRQLAERRRKLEGAS